MLETTRGSGVQGVEVPQVAQVGWELGRAVARGVQGGSLCL